MKTLSKKFVVLFMMACMICSALGQTALAADTAETGIPEGCIAVSDEELMSFTADPSAVSGAETEIWDDSSDDSGIGTYAASQGVRVQRITVYPLGINLDTNELFYHPDIYAQVVYTTTQGASEGIYLSNNQTLGLMQQMMSILSSTGENCYVYGWYLTGKVLFSYDNPQYITFKRVGTSVDSTDEVKQDISGEDVYQDFFGIFTYPQNKDVLVDYYYIGISGACWYKANNGNLIGTAFGISAGFNASEPTYPD